MDGQLDNLLEFAEGVSLGWVTGFITHEPPLRILEGVAIFLYEADMRKYIEFNNSREDEEFFWTGQLVDFIEENSLFTAAFFGGVWAGLLYYNDMMR